jgi:hypothetical protein
MNTQAAALSRRRLVFGSGAAAVLGLAGCVAPPVVAPTQPPRARLRLIGESLFAHRLQFQGSTVGGLSGIDYDAANDLYYLISDDGSSINPARFYTARLALAADSLGEPELLGVSTLRQADGSAYPSALQGGPVPDPEAIRWRAVGNTLLWTSEGHAPSGTAPWLREARPDGSFVREFALPALFNFQAGAGPRGNLTLEGLALAPDGQTAWIAMENALLQDGPMPTVEAPGGPCRFTQIDLNNGKALRQIAYVPDAIPRAPVPPTGFADNGVSEILMLDAERMLVLERAYMAGWGTEAGNSLRLYLIDTHQASDTLALSSLRPGAYRSAGKTLLADFSAFTGPGAGPRLKRLDNTEGMSWGPVLPNGRRSLVFISDDNFSARQISQWLAFEFLD